MSQPPRPPGPLPVQSVELELFPLPYTTRQPPPGLDLPVETVSGQADTAAFHTGLDNRDVFLGKLRCVVCGEKGMELLEHCHIIPRGDTAAWDLLRQLLWAPNGVKGAPEHESRNGVTMCSNHHKAFDNHYFFIRFYPDFRKYILVVYDSYDRADTLLPFHGRAVALDINHPRAPLPLLFMVHEYMVRGRNFYRPGPNLEVFNEWQNWIHGGGITNDDGSFNHDPPPPDDGPGPGPTPNHASPPPPPPPPPPPQAPPPPAPPAPPAPRQSRRLRDLPPSPVAGPSGSRIIMPPTADVIEKLLLYQRTTPSWKAWQRETMDWKGTGEENRKKYIENIGVEMDESD